MSSCRSFKTDLVASNLETDFVEPIYREFFGDLYNSCSSVVTGSLAQHAGVDRIIALQNGKTCAVDEKVRYADYGDILLEWKSTDSKGKIRKGWARDSDKVCDYICYIIRPTSVAYMIPFMPLLQFTQRHGEWLYSAATGSQKGYRVSQATTQEWDQEWTTESVCMPLEDLVRGLATVSKVEFNQHDPYQLTIKG